MNACNYWLESSIPLAFIKSNYDSSTKNGLLTRYSENNAIEHENIGILINITVSWTSS